MITTIPMNLKTVLFLMPGPTSPQQHLKTKNRHITKVKGEKVTKTFTVVRTSKTCFNPPFLVSLTKNLLTLNAMTMTTKPYKLAARRAHYHKIETQSTANAENDTTETANYKRRTTDPTINALIRRL